MSSAPQAATTTAEHASGSIAPGALAEELLALWGRPKGRVSKAPGSPRPPRSLSQQPAEPPEGRRGGEVTDLARAIRFLRGERTQAEVAEAAGLDAAIWSLYETGRRQPREGNLARIVRSLGCTRRELEEVVWRFRRQRLADSSTGAQGADATGVLGEVLRFAGHQHSGQGQEAADAWRQELRPILQRFSAALEELLLFIIRARRGELNSDAASSEPAPASDETVEEPRMARVG
jgi:transcriptional regulator with XRE-family HTH domain